LNQYRESRNLTDALSEWMRQSSTILMEAGKAFYEIAYLVQRVGGNPVGFRLLYLPPQGITRDAGGYAQNVPPGAASEEGHGFVRAESKGESYRLRDDQVLGLQWPPEIALQLQATRDALGLVDANTLPGFFLESSPVSGGKRVQQILRNS